MSWDITDHNEWTWEQIPYGAMTLESGTSEQNLTGGWRVQRPIWNPDICINCLQCWMNCPDSSIIARERTMSGVDLDHCKGCGVCVSVCPVGALTLMEEKAALAQEQSEKEE